MDSLNDLIGAFKAPKEPPEIARIKQFIQDEFQVSAQIAVRGETLVITVRSAALANTLRLRTVKLREVAETSKRLVFRIG